MWQLICILHARICVITIHLESDAQTNARGQSDYLMPLAPNIRHRHKTLQSHTQYYQTIETRTAILLKIHPKVHSTEYTVINTSIQCNVHWNKARKLVKKFTMLKFRILLYYQSYSRKTMSFLVRHTIAALRVKVSVHAAQNVSGQRLYCICSERLD